MPDPKRASTFGKFSQAMLVITAGLILLHRLLTGLGMVWSPARPLAGSTFVFLLPLLFTLALWGLFAVLNTHPQDRRWGLAVAGMLIAGFGTLQMVALMLDVTDDITYEQGAANPIQYDFDVRMLYIALGLVLLNALLVAPHGLRLWRERAWSLPRLLGPAWYISLAFILYLLWGLVAV